MTKNELQFVMKVLDKIKDPDEYVKKARAYVHKDIAVYEARRGQMKEQYDYDLGDW